MSIFNIFSSKTASKTDHSNSPRAGKVAPSEKRVETRHNTFFTTTIKYRNQELLATVLNFSETGLGLLTGKPLRSNEPIELSLSASNHKPVVIKADIKRCLNTGNDYMVGIQTSALGEQYGSLFRSLHQHHAATR